MKGRCLDRVTNEPRYIILKNMVPKTGIEPVREYKSRRILSPVRLPVPPLRHSIFLEATPRFELGIKELQSTALPLGYVAVLVIHPRLERGTP